MLQVSWCVARTSNLRANTDPVPFPKVLVNQGSAWNSSTNQITIPHTDYYYLHISQGVAQRQTWVYMSIRGMQRYTCISLYRNTSPHNGLDTLSRSAIMYITSGTILTIRIDRGCYSNEFLQTSFSGFLLY